MGPHVRRRDPRLPARGLLILRRQPRNTIGWLLQAIGLVWALNGLAENYAVYGMVAEPGSLPGPEFVAAFSEAGWIPAIGVMGTFLFLLYPDGHLPSRRWRPVAWVCAFTMVLGTVAIILDPGTMEESPLPDTQNPLAWEAGAPLLNVLLFVVLPLPPVGDRRVRRSPGLGSVGLAASSGSSSSGSRSPVPLSPSCSSSHW